MPHTGYDVPRVHKDPGIRRATVLRAAIIAAAAGAAAIGIGIAHWYRAPVCAVAVLWGSAQPDHLAIGPRSAAWRP